MISARLRRMVVAVACPLLLLAGCGNSRAPVPSRFHPATSAGHRPRGYSSAGLAFEAPSNWTVISDRGPLVSGHALLSPLKRWLRLRPAATA